MHELEGREELVEDVLLVGRVDGDAEVEEAGEVVGEVLEDEEEVAG